MKQNSSYLNYKLQQPYQEQYSDNPSSTSRKFKVKELLRRYRDETSQPSNEQDHLKVKLLDSYSKLQVEITENQRLKEMIKEEEERVQDVMQENMELKKLLQKVIENRKHLDKQLEDSMRVNQALRKEMGERRGREEELASENKLLREHQEVLKQVIDNNTKQIQSLECIVRGGNQSFASSSRSNRRSTLSCQKRSSIHHQTNTDSGAEKQSEMYNNQNLQPNIQHNTGQRDQSKPRVRQRQFKVGKWKKNTPTIQQPNPQQNTNIHRNPSLDRIQPKPKQGQTQNDDQMLTIEQNKKRSLDQQLGKLMKIKKPGIQQSQRIQEIEVQLYRTESNISRLKRKIRSKY